MTQNAAWALLPPTLRRRPHKTASLCGDALRLQRLAAEPDFEAVALSTDRAKAVLAHIRQKGGTRGH